MSLLLLFSLLSLIPTLIHSQETLPNPLPSCSNKQLSNNTCGTVNCLDPRCLTCSPTSTTDCLLCSSSYNVSRLTPGTGSCIKTCANVEVNTDHYKLSLGSTFSANDDTCLAANCSDSLCLSCLSGTPGLCLLCPAGYYPAYDSVKNTATCTLCSSAILNCSSCAWGSYCFQCQSGSIRSPGGYLLTANAGGCQACNKAFSRCGVCDGIKTCSSCETGYFMSNGKCSSCLRNCDICADKTACSQCKAGYYQANSSTCTLCSSTFKNCLSCQNNQACDKCKSSYYLSSATQCTQCSQAPNAIKCNGTHIIKCADNTTIVLAEKRCAPCSDTPHCAYCDGTKCLICGPGFLLAQNGTCLPDSSIPFCKKSDGKYCVKCVPDYFLVSSFDNTTNATAISCNYCGNISNCSYCDGIGCGYCEDNFFLKNTKMCNSCDTFGNCSKCDGKQCVLCKDGFFLHNDDGKISCISCSDPVVAIDRCIRCHDGNACRKCDVGYLLDSNLKCKSIFTVKNCYSTNGMYCTACYAGYYLLENTCPACPDPNCQSCAYDPITQTAPCSLCRAGNYLDPKTSSCIKCSQHSRGSHCVTCDYLLDNTGSYDYQCTRCDDSYGVVLTKNNCTSCTMPNCGICAFDLVANKTLCTSCNSGYYKEDSGVCTFCGDSHCLSCNKSGTSYVCDQCQDSYYLDPNNMCQPCTKASDGCSQCSLNTTTGLPVCSKCSSQKYIFNTTSALCVGCGSLVNNCSMCTLDSTNTSLTNCFICSKNFYLQTPQSCTKCQSPYCLICSGFDAGKTCSSCQPGYFVTSSGTCDVCANAVSNCKNCTQTTPAANATCDVCLPGFYLNKTKGCSPCGQNCLTCVNETHCAVCAGGFYTQINKTGSYCLSQQCQAPTSIGNDTTKACYLCSDLYENCSECSIAENCTKCKDSNASLMLPYSTSCAVCGDDMHVATGTSGYCAYRPKINYPVSKGRSSLTGKVNFKVDCSVAQKFIVYGVYFLNYDNYMSKVAFSEIQKKFDSVNGTLTVLSRNTSDRYWTVYWAVESDQNGKVDIWVSEFMNAGVAYRLYSWCFNNGSSAHPLSIVSDNNTLDWLQDDNLGKTIKLIFYIEKSLDDTQRKGLADVLDGLLGLSAMNRKVVYDVIPDQSSARRVLETQNYEFFYIKRDYAMIPEDNTNMYLLRTIDDPTFKSTLNSKVQSLNFQISTFSHIQLDSSFQFQIPVFRSIDFPRLLSFTNSSVSMNLSIINTNAKIYLGTIDDVTIESVDWNLFVQENATSSKKFLYFQSKFLKANEVFEWNNKNLSLGTTYALYVGATNEDEFQWTLRTPIHRVIFRPKNVANT